MGISGSGSPVAGVFWDGATFPYDWYWDTLIPRLSNELAAGAGRPVFNLMKLGRIEIEQ